MHIYDNDLDKYTFNGCNTCQECCAGEKFIIAPLILEDFPLVSTYFPIFFGYIDGNLKTFMLFSDGTNPCPYLKDSFCTIYSVRPPACQTYPLTPFNKEVLCDTGCPGVQEKKDFPFGIKFLNDKKKVSENFYPKRFENFPTKLAQTNEWLNKVESLLISSEKEIKGIKLLQIQPNHNMDIYTNMHLKSLKHIDIFKNF